MNKNNNKIKATIITIVFHALLLIVFLFYGLTTPLPLPEEEGIEVNLGYSDQGMGDFQPDELSSNAASSSPSSSSDESILAEDNEENPALSEKVNKNQTVTNEQTNKTEESKPQEHVDSRALYPGNQDKNATNGNEGITGKPGDQGNPYGNPNSDNYNGNSGNGNGEGISYKLSGRSYKNLPKPNYNSMEQGKVVVKISVDRQGNVLKAESGVKGTTTSSQTLWKLAKDAALKAKFDANANAPEEQIGTISYNFIRLN